RGRIRLLNALSTDAVTKPIRVLYAENDPTEAELTKLGFAAHAPDLQLEVVGTGHSCLARLAETDYDVLLLDNDLPDMDGVDVLNQLAGHGWSHPMPTIACTGGESSVF